MNECGKWIDHAGWHRSRASHPGDLENVDDKEEVDDNQVNPALCDEKRSMDSAVSTISSLELGHRRPRQAGLEDCSGRCSSWSGDRAPESTATSH